MQTLFNFRGIFPPDFNNGINDDACHGEKQVGESLNSTPMIRSASAEDARSVADIYNFYIENTIITFEESPLSAQVIRTRILDHKEGHPWLVCEIEGEVVGYAYSSPWHERSAYRMSAETAIYLSHFHLGKRIGSTLYAALIDELQKENYHAAFALIGLPNPASIGLVKKFGFHQVGVLQQVGRKFDRWVDVGIWQLILSDPGSRDGS